MNRHYLLALFATLLCAPALHSQSQLSLAPREGVLLLVNGQVITGTITAAGDRYDVVREDVEVRVKRSEVLAVCDNLQECYRHRLSSIDAERALDHLELAEWCLKQGLIESAEMEIEAARILDKSHPRIRLLEPRLALAKEGPRRPDTPVSSDKPADPQQYDQLVRNLPPGAMEQFTNTIQPMLLNYCSKSGCHASRSTAAMRLERIPPSRLAGRHTTQHNLAAALAMIDREHPPDSKLLQAPIRPHANMKLPVFTDREQAQYRQLVQWVFQVATPQPAAPPTLAERAAPLAQNVEGVRTAGALRGPQVDKAVKPAAWSDSFPDQGQEPAEVQQATATRPVPDGKPAPDGSVPKDEFDPAIFNRRYFKR